jgi:hypothetical protein
LAISSAGLAPNAAEHNTLTRAITATATIARSARPKWRFDLKRRDGIPEMVLIGVFSFDNGRSRRIIFDVFISLESSFLFSRKLVPIFASARLCPARYCEIDRPDKLNFPV